jgi:ATP-binding cassette subfamily B protein
VVIGAFLNLSAPWFIKRIVDVALPAGDLRRLWLYCAGMIAGPLAAGLVQVVQKQAAESIGQQVTLDLRIRLYRHLHDMPYDFFVRQKPGEAVSHMLNDAQGVGAAVSGTLVDIVQNAAVLLTTIAFVLALDWRLATIVVAFLPVFITPTRRVGLKRKALKRAVQARTTEFTGMVTETLSVSGALLVKAFGRERAEVERLSATAQEIQRLALKQSLVGRWFRLALGLFESMGPAAVFAAGGYLVVRGHIPLGTVVALVAVLKRLYGPASDLASVHVDLITSYVYFERVFDLLDRVPSIANPVVPVTANRIEGAIQLHGVSLSYDDAGDALTEIDLEIPAGATVGIVGPSGAGKSSIASLVMRLYDPTAGTISIDGVDLRTMDLAALRGSIGIVTQDTFLFNGTVRANLQYAKPTASRADVEDAARRAQIHDVITALPQGYDTVVGERGYRFSAGQRQRLAIARAILKDPRILILDEATSSLDSESERKVHEAIGPLLTGRTSLLIAHRLSTVCRCDVIVVLNRGRIVERGRHDELIARAGLYSWLWHAQSRSQPVALSA